MPCNCFRCYLYGCPIILVTDHQPFKFLIKSYWLIGKLAKWAFILEKFDFDVMHKANRTNQNANGLNQNLYSNKEILLRWKSFKVYHIGWKGPSPYCNPFFPYILIPIKINESKVVKNFRIIF
jgi:hypothetical protein